MAYCWVKQVPYKSILIGGGEPPKIPSGRTLIAVYCFAPSMVKRTVLKVDISCQKCKTKLLQAVSGLQGVDKIDVDAVKSTMTVTGDVDPIDVVVRVRKTGKFAEVVSIGPPPKPDAEKKPEVKKLEPANPVMILMPSTCSVCQDHGYSCYIL